ncbi:MAG TPA: GNAT family N-acetyltransferase [Baekduia sp.]|uniref:GNAT family N-acetyltransferase n=1 Tax=Baekduia sp. TaxID=2600305 RepID=UPI002D787831|nr:GNAT family N-acetyltransferase [Baekduia sp.]HET6508370.1 GNAT family N-acetyltransferase [Baekduia sp.]
MADLVVRAYEADDAAALEAAVAASREHLRPWMAWAAGPPPGVAWRRRWIRDVCAEEAAGGDRYRGFFDAADGTLLGSGGLHRRIGPRAWEIGYWVHVDQIGRGVATAAVAQLVAEAFSDPDVDLVQIHHDAANLASGAVARRSGFTDLGTVAKPNLAAPGETGVERRWRLEREAAGF